MTSNALIVVHKLIRGDLFEIATLLSRAGADDVESAVKALDELCEMLEGHAAKEGEALAPALDQATATRMLADHVLLDDQVDQVRKKAHALLACDDATREARLPRLCLDFYAFVAAYLVHLNDEELAMMPILGEKVPSVAAIAASAATLPLEARTAFMGKLYGRVTPSERHAIETSLASAR